jgi:hypothetical protein
MNLFPSFINTDSKIKQTQAQNSRESGIGIAGIAVDGECEMKNPPGAGINVC